jgi:AcrR family transcriptional regulator
MPRTKTLGRPPGANSEETRRRILDVARNHIGARGYAKATLKEISSEAGLTSGAIYYYFQSKQELVNALIAETHDAIEGRFRTAAQTAETLPAKLVAVLEATQEIMAEEPDLARFSVTMRVDGPRYPELRTGLERSSRAYFAFYRQLVDEAMANGEIQSDLTPQQVADTCSVLNLGLTVLAVQVPQDRHRRAIRAVERLVEGTLFSASATKAFAKANGRSSR